MQSGMYAARAAFAALKRGDVSAAALAAYDRMIDESYIVADMRRTRNMRLAFKDGLYVGGVKAGPHDHHRRPLPRRTDHDARGRQDAAHHVRAAALHARRHAHVQQAGRGVQVGQRDARHHSVAPARRPGRDGRRSPTSTRTSVPRASTSGWATSSGSMPPTASTARPPTCSVRGGRLARAGAGRSTATCKIHAVSLQLFAPAKLAGALCFPALPQLRSSIDRQ